MFDEVTPNTSALPEATLGRATREYHRFKFNYINRDINPRHVKKLEQEIVDMGMVMVPVLVDQEWNVIDGQHRIMACENLGMPVPYLLTKSMSIEDVVRLNNVTLKWSQLDRVKSYARQGNEHYQRLLSFYEHCAERVPSISMSVCAKLAQGNMSQGGGGAFISKGKTLKNGLWEFKGTTDEAIERFEMCMHFEEFGFAFTESFLSALYTCLKHEEFSIKVFKTRALKYRDRLFRCSTKNAYLRMIEDVMNYRRCEKNHIRLF